VVTPRIGYPHLDVSLSEDRTLASRGAAIE